MSTDEAVPEEVDEEEYEGDEGDYWEGDLEEEQEAQADPGDAYDGDFDQPLAFKVDGPSQQSHSEPPADAAEYLRRVRQEASALGPVKRAREIDPNSFKHKQTRYVPQIELAAPCPDHLKPDPAWEQQFSADFTAIREAVLNLRSDVLSEDPLPSLKDRKSWLYFIFGADFLPIFSGDDIAVSSCTSSSSLSPSSTLTEAIADGTSQGASSICSLSTTAAVGSGSNSNPLVNSQSVSASSSGHLPVLSLLHRFDQITVRMLVGLLTDTDFTSTFGYHLCVWLFCLLAYLDKPIDDDMCAILRNLYRKLAHMRASQKKEGKVVAYCNLLLSIVHSVFNQSVPTEL